MEVTTIIKQKDRGRENSLDLQKVAERCIERKMKGTQMLDFGYKRLRENKRKNFILDTPVDTFLQSKRNFGERVLSIFLA